MVTTGHTDIVLPVNEIFVAIPDVEFPDTGAVGPLVTL